MQNTGDADWDGLLEALTQEELLQYGRISLDQVERVDRWFNVQVGALALGAGLACWGVWSGFKAGLGVGTLYWVAPAMGALYWLYRSVKARRLWSAHFGAVNDELSRRGEGTMTTGSKSQ